MNSKTIVLVAVAIVAVAAMGALVLLGDDGEDSEYFDVTYHGNGGEVGAVDDYRSPNTSVADCRFVNSGLHFYMWNTEADGSGTYFSPSIDTDDAKLLKSGAKDLFAIWTYEINGFIKDFNIEGIQSPIIKLTFPDSPSVPAQILNKGRYLDPGSDKALITVTSPYDGDIWTIGPDYTFTASDTYHYLSVSFSGISGMNVSSCLQTSPGVIELAFGYSGDVEIDIDTVSADLLVTYHGNGGAAPGGVTETQSYEDDVLSSRFFSREGMTFMEWNSEADGTGVSIVYGPEAYDSVVENRLTDLYAIWGYGMTADITINQTSVAPFSAEISFPAKGTVAAHPLGSTELYSDATVFRVTLTSPAASDSWVYDASESRFSCEGTDHYYAFAFSDLVGLTAGTPVVSGNTAYVDFTYSGACSISFYVETSDILVTYHGNGGTTLEGAVIVKSSDDSVLGYGSFGRAGYVMDRWTENADGTGKSVECGSGYRVILDNHLTDLYAHWVPAL